MEEIAKLISNYGVQVIIICMFIYDWLTNKKKISETLDEMKISNTNTSKSLELLQRSMDNQQEFLKVHDKRCETSTNGILNIEKEISQINLKIGR
ncbi:MAG: hypothetical protein RSG48_03715 [Clostridia bacterium]